MDIDFNNPQLLIRPMQLKDLDAIMQVENKAYEFPWALTIFEGCMRSSYTNLVYQLDQQILGYGIMSVAAGEAHILNLCINPIVQGQGLGRKLLKHLIAQAGRMDTDSIFLEVRVSNKAAIRLYHSIGFNEIGRRYDYYPSHHAKEDALVFALSL